MKPRPLCGPSPVPPRCFGSPLRTQDTQFVMAEGSVRTIGPKVDRAVLEALATPDGGELAEDQ